MARDRGKRVLDALADYPGGANLSVLAEDLPDLTRPDINSALTYLFRKGRITRSGQRGGYIYALAEPDFSMPGEAEAKPAAKPKAASKPKAAAKPKRKAPSGERKPKPWPMQMINAAATDRRLEDDDPRVIVARSAALMLPPELRGHLVALADWATGKQKTH